MSDTSNNLLISTLNRLTQIYKYPTLCFNDINLPEASANSITQILWEMERKNKQQNDQIVHLTQVILTCKTGTQNNHSKLKRMKRYIGKQTRKTYNAIFS